MGPPDRFEIVGGIPGFQVQTRRFKGGCLNGRK